MQAAAERRQRVHLALVALKQCLYQGPVVQRLHLEVLELQPVMYKPVRLQAAARVEA
jgi:hypothetical protein